MLEKLAEIIRREAESTGATEEFPACMACDFAPKNSRVCQNRWCINPSYDGGSLMLARWAVLLVAKGLIHARDELNLDDRNPTYASELLGVLDELIAEAKEEKE